MTDGSCDGRWRGGLALVALAPLVCWLAAEAVQGWAARRGVREIGRLDGPGSPETLLVLGYRSQPDGTVSPVQRWRVDLGARNATCATRFVISGAGEAEAMASDLIGRHGVDAGRVRCENRATTTWENIGLAAPLIAPGGVVRMISDPLHARRAERYWRLQQPGRATELRAASLYRFGEHPVLKVGTAAYAVVLRTLRYRPGNRIWQRVAANR